MHCIRSPRFSILWNGNRLAQFSPGRGIRQGDAMSPAIFALCMEKLSQMITLQVNSGVWKGIQFTPDSPTLSHLCFANDTVLFAKASIEQVAIIQDCLTRFCDASGQRISYAKSQVCFSRNTDLALATEIARMFQIDRTDDLGKYLGVPSIHGRVSCQSFSDLLDRVNNRLDGWRARTLYIAGRVTLARSV